MKKIKKLFTLTILSVISFFAIGLVTKAAILPMENSASIVINSLNELCAVEAVVPNSEDCEEILNGAIIVGHALFSPERVVHTSDVLYTANWGVTNARHYQILFVEDEITEETEPKLFRITTSGLLLVPQSEKLPLAINYLVPAGVDIEDVESLLDEAIADEIAGFMTFIEDLLLYMGETPEDLPEDDEELLRLKNLITNALAKAGNFGFITDELDELIQDLEELETDIDSDLAELYQGLFDIFWGDHEEVFSFTATITEQELQEVLDVLEDYIDLLPGAQELLYEEISKDAVTFLLDLIFDYVVEDYEFDISGLMALIPWDRNQTNRAERNALLADKEDILTAIEDWGLILADLDELLVDLLEDYADSIAEIATIQADLDELYDELIDAEIDWFIRNPFIIANLTTGTVERDDKLEIDRTLAAHDDLEDRTKANEDVQDFVNLMGRLLARIDILEGQDAEDDAEGFIADQGASGSIDFADLLDTETPFEISEANHMIVKPDIIEAINKYLELSQSAQDWLNDEILDLEGETALDILAGLLAQVAILEYEDEFELYLDFIASFATEKNTAIALLAGCFNDGTIPCEALTGDKFNNFAALLEELEKQVDKFSVARIADDLVTGIFINYTEELAILIAQAIHDHFEDDIVALKDVLEIAQAIAAIGEELVDLNNLSDATYIRQILTNSGIGAAYVSGWAGYNSNVRNGILNALTAIENALVALEDFETELLDELIALIKINNVLMVANMTTHISAVRLAVTDEINRLAVNTFITTHGALIEADIDDATIINNTAVGAIGIAITAYGSLTSDQQALVDDEYTEVDDIMADLQAKLSKAAVTVPQV